MTDASAPKINRRTLLAGTAAAAAVGGAAAMGAGNYWLGGRRESPRSAGKKVIVIGIDGMDPRLSRAMMKAGLLPNLAKLRAAGGFSPLGTSIPPQSPVAWANFINGAGPGSHGIFDFIHRHPAGAVRPVLLGRGDAPRRGGLGSRRPPAPARFLAVQPQAARDRAPAPGHPVLGLPRRGGRPLDVLRPAVQLPAQPVAARPSPLHLRHGHAGHAGHLRHLPALRRGRPGRAARRAGRQAVEADVRGRDGPGPDRRPGRQPAQDAEADRRRVPRPPRPRSERRGDRDPGPEDRPEGRPVEPLDEARLRALHAVVRAEPERQRHLPLLSPGGRPELPALRDADQHGPGRPRAADVRAGVVRQRRVRDGSGRSTPRASRKTTRPGRTASSSTTNIARQADMVLEERLALLRLRHRQLRRRPAVLLLLQQRPAVAHVLVGLGREAPDPLRRPRRRSTSGTSAGSTRSSTRSSAT